MKHIKKILAIAMVMVMALTALTFSGGAESIYDTAKSITSGQAISATIRDTNDTVDYKINVSKAGELKISANAQMQTMRLMVYDSKGNVVEPTSYSSTSGNSSYYYNHDCLSVTWNNVIEQSDFKAVYSVSKGTYYIRFEWGWNIYADNQGNGKIKLTATFPSSASKGKLYYLSLTVDKGDTIKLGAVVSSGSKVTWTSSKPAVASVSSGKVTAKTKGSTIITAKCGSTSQKIKITVV